MPDGEYKIIGNSGGWRVVRGMAFYKKRLFLLYSTRLTEMLPNTYVYRDHSFGKSKTLTRIQQNSSEEALLIYDGNVNLGQLYKVTFPAPTPNKTKKAKLGRFNLYPDVVAYNHQGKLICKVLWSEHRKWNGWATLWSRKSYCCCCL